MRLLVFKRPLYQQLLSCPSSFSAMLPWVEGWGFLCRLGTGCFNPHLRHGVHHLPADYVKPQRQTTVTGFCRCSSAKWFGCHSQNQFQQHEKHRSTNSYTNMSWILRTYLRGSEKDLTYMQKNLHLAILANWHALLRPDTSFRQASPLSLRF